MRIKAACGTGFNSTRIAFIALLASLFCHSVASAACHPESLGNQSTIDASLWQTQSGPYTYIQTSADQLLTKFGDDTLTKFSVVFNGAGSIHLQLWSEIGDNNYVLKQDQIFSAGSEGLYELSVSWPIGENDFWGFSHEGEGMIPVSYMSDSKVQALSIRQFFGKSSSLEQSLRMNQDSPMLFNVKVCTDRLRSGPMVRNQVSYTCNRRVTWDTASDLYGGPSTYIHGQKITTPVALLKDVEVQMEIPNFITIQVWRKDPANFEFLLVKEKTFYAKFGYNSLPVNIQMQYGDQWGFSLNSQGGNSILYQNVSSDNSYFFPQFISGVGSKRSYASLPPTPMEFKIAPCIQVSENEDQQSTLMSFGASGSFQNSNPSSSYQYNPNVGLNPTGMPYNMQNPSTQNGINYPAAYGPYGGAQSAFFPQASATNCYCTDNTYWFSAENTLFGPFTFIDPEAFTEQNANIEAFEFEAHLPGVITIQIWRPAGPNMNSMYLVWEKDISLRQGYQRVNLAYTVMAGDRWGFISKSNSEIPIKYYDDQSSYGHEFQYQVSAATGQQIYLSSALISQKKFKMRPCICSTIDGLASLGGGMPYNTAPQLTYDNLNSANNVYSGTGYLSSGQPSNQFGSSGGYGSPSTSWSNGGYGSSSMAGSTGGYGSSGYNSGYGPSGLNGGYGGGYGSSGMTGSNGGYGSSGMTGSNSGYGSSGIIGSNSGYGSSGMTGSNGGYGSSGMTGSNSGYGSTGMTGSNGGYGSSGMMDSNSGYGSSGMTGSNNGYGSSGMTGSNGGYGSSGMTGTNGGYGSNNPVGSFGFSYNGYSQPLCQGVTVNQAGLCSDCGMYEVVGPYTYINFNKLPRGRMESVDIFARNSGSVMLQIWRFDPSSNSLKVFYEKPVGLRSYPSTNRISVSEEIMDNDMIGFSYLGNGIVPIQYSSTQDVRSYEENTGRSKTLGNDEINLPRGYSSKQFNMKVCMATSSYQAQSAQYINNPQAQQSYYPHIQFSNGLNQNGNNGGSYPVQNNFNSGTHNSYSQSNQMSNAYIQQLMGFLQQLNSGMSVDQINQNSNLQSSSMEPNCAKSQDGDADGPFESQIRGPYIYVGDFENIRNNRVSFIQYQASAYGEIFFFKIRPNLGKFEIIGDPIKSIPTSLFEPTKVEVDWCMQPNEKIGFFYRGSSNVPIKFTYSFGSSLELPLEAPESNIINELYETTKSFDISVHFNTLGCDSSCQVESNMNNNNFENSFYNSNQFQANFGFNNQRAYISPGFAWNPLLDQFPSQISGPSCIGYPVDNHISMGSYPGPLTWFIPIPFGRDGRLKHIELESSKTARVFFFQVGVRNQYYYELINGIDYNLFPGINKINQQYVNWEIEQGDYIGFVSIDQSVPITYTIDFSNNIQFNINGCLEDLIYNSPTTYQNPVGNPALTGNGANAIIGASGGDTCSCYDNSHWPYGFEEVYGPYVYINGEDFRQVTGFIKAFEIEAAISGPITLHIWRKASPVSDRLTKVWTKDVNLQAGYQRIEGINANIQDGDLWGFTFGQSGMVPINFLTDTNYIGYETRDPATVYSTSQSVIFLSSANIGYKRFKLRPCICTYGTQSNVNQLSNAFSPGLSYSPNSFSPQSSGYYNNQGSFSNNGFTQTNIGNSPPGPTSLPTQNYAQQSAMSPQYPTNTYQYCYGSLDTPGSLSKFGPYTHINFEPLPAGTIENIEFEPSRPGTLTWYIWRQNPILNDFEVIYEKEITFQSGKQSLQIMEDTQERDLIGFHYSETDEIPIKFAENVGAQAYEDISPITPIIGTAIPPPGSLEDKLFNYKVCMYSVTSQDAPLQTTSNIGGYGYSYNQQTSPYYASGPQFGNNPGFGPSPSPMPGYDYANNYYPNPTYGISQYDPVQAYTYDYYYNPSSGLPTYGSATQNNPMSPPPQAPTGTPYGYNAPPQQSQYPYNYQQTQNYNAAYNANYDMQGTGQYQGGYYY